MVNKVIHKTGIKKGVKPKVLVVLGATASGKTALGVKLAAELNGEIVSADSRQVYKGMDVGTGKDLAAYRLHGREIPYHLIDIADPRKSFDLAKYQKLAFAAIEKILRKGKLPIIVGGSGLYLQAIVDNYQLGQVRPNIKKRREREGQAAAELFAELARLKPEFARRLNNSDRHNPRRLVRYLEIIEAGGDRSLKQPSPYDFLILGLSHSDKIMRERIEYRLLERLETAGLVAEVQGLHQAGLSWERLHAFGLEYRFISEHLLGRLSYQEMVEKLTTASYRFAKRQQTWFKRWQKQGALIKWVKNETSARRAVSQWRRAV
ncbi:MAG: tRNA (adenosine(37)-N6)-dimethylallyltransferase MiaA [Patescibacteria group bacterium]